MNASILRLHPGADISQLERSRGEVPSSSQTARILNLFAFLMNQAQAAVKAALLYLPQTGYDSPHWFKGTLQSKLALGFFSWPQSIYYFDLSLTSFTFVKLELRVQGTHFYGDAGEFDGRRGINLGIWSQWLYHGTDD